MPGTKTPFLPSTEQVNKQIAEAREVTARAVALLRSLPKPDTFMGRKTHDPFPSEQHEDGQSTASSGSAPKR